MGEDEECGPNQLKAVLKRIYFDPKQPSSFSGVDALYRRAKEETTCHITRDFIKKWLSDVPSYSLHKPARKKFPRLHYVVDGPYEQMQADLLDFGALVEYNEAYRYLLVVMDIFSRMVWIYKLKTKTAKDLKTGLAHIFKECGFYPKKFQSDKGTEFKNVLVQKFLKDHNITWFATENQEIKCSHVERFHQTLERRLHRYFTHNQTRNWIDSVQDIVDSYNQTSHRSLNYSTPKDVTAANAEKFRSLPKMKQLFQRLPNIKIKVGDYVRISLKKSQMEKGALQSWSSEVYVVKEKLQVQGVYMYKIKDLLDEDMVGRFYPYELQVVPEQTNESAPIEIIKRKGNKVLVHYIGWHKKFDMWMSKKDIQQK